MPHDFLMHYDEETLSHIIRYLTAITVRAERGIVHLEKEYLKTAEVNLFSDKLQDMIKYISPVASVEKLRALEEFRWMIEEYKVSVFAQEIKTALPISRKRLEKKVQEIKRIV